MLDEDDLSPADLELLDMLNDGRITAPFAAGETGYSLQYVRDRLTRMVEHGNAIKVYDGLYEFVEDPREGDLEDALRRGAEERGLVVHDHAQDDRYLRVASPGTDPDDLEPGDIVFHIPTTSPRELFPTKVEIESGEYFGGSKPFGKYETIGEALDAIELVLNQANNEHDD